MTTIKSQHRILPKPSSACFAEYVETKVTPFLYDQCNRDMANQLLVLIQYLERKRYDFSASRAFQTRPICINQIAEHFRVTHRSVQRWFALLESFGLLVREYRKDPKHAFKNKFSRIAFPSFKSWFERTLETAKQILHDTLRHPPKKAISDSNLMVNENSVERHNVETFPISGGVKYNRYWYEIAMKHLPSGRMRPCTTMVAQRFRENIKGYDLPLDHPSLTARWISFCKRAKPAF